jgi:hypothetical protein
VALKDLDKNKHEYPYESPVTPAEMRDQTIEDRIQQRTQEKLEPFQQQRESAFNAT